MPGTRFEGEPQTLWLNEAGQDRKMRLVESLRFYDRRGHPWEAPKDSVIDGASIPRALWSLVGSPYTGDYRRASVVHDIACVNAHDPAARKAADRMFYEACREGGCSVAQSIILYIGVRIGAKTGRGEAGDIGPRLAIDALDREIVLTFSDVAQIVLANALADDAEVVEAQVDEAFEIVRRAGEASTMLRNGGPSELFISFGERR